MESFVSQEKEVEFNEEGNRKLPWVLIEKVAKQNLRPSQGCNASGLLSAQIDPPFYPLRILPKDGLCKACPLPTPTAWP